MPAPNPSGHHTWYGLSIVLLLAWLTDRYALMGQFSFLVAVVFAITGWELGRKKMSALQRHSGTLGKTIGKSSGINAHDLEKMLTLVIQHQENKHDKH